MSILILASAGSNTVFTAIPLACASPVFESCKIRIKFQMISEKLKHQKSLENYPEITRTSSAQIAQLWLQWHEDK